MRRRPSSSTRRRYLDSQHVVVEDQDVASTSRRYLDSQHVVVEDQDVTSTSRRAQVYGLAIIRTKS